MCPVVPPPVSPFVEEEEEDMGPAVEDDQDNADQGAEIDPEKLKITIENNLSHIYMVLLAIKVGEATNQVDSDTKKMMAVHNAHEIADLLHDLAMDCDDLARCEETIKWVDYSGETVPAWLVMESILRMVVMFANRHAATTSEVKETLKRHTNNYEINRAVKCICNVICTCPEADFDCVVTRGMFGICIKPELWNHKTGKSPHFAIYRVYHHNMQLIP